MVGSFYRIMCSDKALKEDNIVGRRVNRAAARREVKRLNELSLEMFGPTGRLYYAERAQEAPRPKSGTLS